jgi:hypothetical protein
MPIAPSRSEGISTAVSAGAYAGRRGGTQARPRTVGRPTGARSLRMPGQRRARAGVAATRTPSWHAACALSLDVGGLPRLRVLVALAMLAAVPAAGQPLNDACTTRPDVVFLPFAETTFVGTATVAPGEAAPVCAPPGFAHSVWYAMTPPREGLYRFSTCGSDFDTVMQLFRGAVFPSCDGLRRIDEQCNDDSDLCGPESRQSMLIARLPAGPDGLAHLQIGSVGPAAGTLRISMALVPEPSNDACAGARFIGRPVFREVLNLRNASGGEPADRTFLSRCGAAGNVDLGEAPHSVWYRYTAARAGRVTVDTRGSTTAIAVAVFKETTTGCARLGARAACGAGRPAEFTAVAGQTYRVYVAAPTPVEPDLLVFRLTGPNTPPLAVAEGAPQVAPGTPVRLDARGSSDPDGDLLTFAWVQTSGPAVGLSDPASAEPTFTAPRVTTDTALAFELTVSDGAAVARAALAVTVTTAVDDLDRDGVPAARDSCPATPAGEAVDDQGCACSDAGHADCGPGASQCAPGRCDPVTGRCLADPAPRGAPCPDDGDLCTQDVCDGAGSCGHLPAACARACRTDRCDPATGLCGGGALAAGTSCADDGNFCTDDVCDGAGTCTHARVGSFVGATCRLDDLAGTFAVGRKPPPRFARVLARLIGDTRAALAVADAAARLGDAPQARSRLGRAARKLALFEKHVTRLEARRRLDSPDAGRLLDAARDAAGEIAALREALRPRRR